MLNQGIVNQLKDVFSGLSQETGLVYHQSTHSKQKELLALLEQLAASSERLTVSSSELSSDVPSFELRVDGQNTGIFFQGVPGGHEFSSLVLAILNSQGLGKLPDEALIERMRRIKGPIHLRTYVSLSCENCPEVVQALNLLAAINPGVQHTMVDGGLKQDEVKQLGIQGVPSVMDGHELISSGKTNLMRLVERLESRYGSEDTVDHASLGSRDLGLYDVAVIGGGPAGASAAIYSARKGLKTVVLAETMGGQVQETKGIENLISVPYTEGPQLAAQLGRHLAEYKIQVLEHRLVDEIEQGETEKTLRLNSGEWLKTKSVIVATGAKWRELGIPGEKEYLGKGVAYCPHCDGPYFKGKDVVVVGGGNSGVEAAIDLAGIVKHVTVIEYMDELKADKVLVDKLEGLANASILTNAACQEVLGNGQRAEGISYLDRTSGKEHTLSCDGVFVQIGLKPNSAFLRDLVELSPAGEIIIDDKCRTSIKGVYAAGDVTTTPYKQIIISMGEGAKAALTSYEDMVMG